MAKFDLNFAPKKMGGRLFGAYLEFINGGRFGSRATSIRSMQNIPSIHGENADDKGMSCILQSVLYLVHRLVDIPLE